MANDETTVTALPERGHARRVTERQVQRARDEQRWRAIQYAFCTPGEDPRGTVMGVIAEVRAEMLKRWGEGER